MRVSSVKLVHYDKCPLCLSEKTGTYLEIKDHFLSKEVFNVFRCIECGFIFTQDHPDEENIFGYYKSEDYLSHNDDVKSLFSFFYRISRELMLNRKLRIIRKASGLSTGVLLDIGSGSGRFAAFMKKHGWGVSGIEINKAVRDKSSMEYGFPVFAPDQLSSLQSENFDCITLWHSLEHFQDPFKYTNEIKRLLKPGGTCILALPNSSSCDAEYYREFWGAWDVPRHLWHFTPETVKKFSEKSAFAVSDILRLPFDVYYVSILSEKYRAARLPLVSGLIKALWFSLLSFFRINRSSSLIYILNK